MMKHLKMNMKWIKLTNYSLFFLYLKPVTRTAQEEPLCTVWLHLIWLRRSLQVKQAFSGDEMGEPVLNKTSQVSKSGFSDSV